MRIRLNTVVKTLAAALVLAACGGDDGHSPSDGGAGSDGGSGDGRTTVVETPIAPKLDLLVVIDDSTSTQDKQQNLAANFPNFINVLNQGTGGLPDLHLAVVTSDMGTKGSASATPAPPIGAVGNGGCANTGKDGQFQLGQATAADLTGKFITDERQPDGSRLTNYTGTLAEVFGKLAQQGSGGCGFEQPLAAMKAAFDGTNPTQAAFLRDDAVLGVVFLTDEDDCSVTDPGFFAADPTTLGPVQSFRCTRFGVRCETGGKTPDEMNTVGNKSGCTDAVSSQLIDPVAPYHDFLVGLKGGDASRVVVSAIAAVPEPFAVELRAPSGSSTPIPALAHSCSYVGSGAELEVGDPAVRLNTFLGMFPGHSAFTTVCQQDLSDGLSLVGQLTSQATGTLCINATLADKDPTAPGVQNDCLVDVTVGGSSHAVPACSLTVTSECWQLITDARCQTGDHQELTILSTLDPTAVVRMRCTVAH